MVTRYGMSDKIGPLALEGGRGRPLFGQGVEDKGYSEKVGSDIDAEVSRIMNEAFEKAIAVVTKDRKALDAIAQKLVEVETIEQAEFEKILVANGIVPKKKIDIEHLN
jgi:cell division protease FtsH